MGKISVIIPTYNREDTILRAIDSVLDQTVEPHEILVCDDGSTDGTETLVKRMKDKRIRWISGKHTGLPAVPRNKGITESKGEWLAFLDSDDWWFPTKLEKQLALAQQKGLLAVSSNAVLVHRQNDYKKLLNFKKNVITFNDLVNTNYVICSSTIIHSSLLKKCIGFPEDSSLIAIEDYTLWLRIATQTPFGYIREPLAYYNDDDISIRSKAPQTIVEQKKRVFTNFLMWGKRKNISADYRNEIETALNYLHP